MNKVISDCLDRMGHMSEAAAHLRAHIAELESRPAADFPMPPAGWKWKMMPITYGEGMEPEGPAAPVAAEGRDLNAPLKVFGYVDQLVQKEIADALTDAADPVAVKQAAMDSGACKAEAHNQLCLECCNAGLQSCKLSAEILAAAPVPASESLTLAEVWAAIGGNPAQPPGTKEIVLETLAIVSLVADECEEKHSIATVPVSEAANHLRNSIMNLPCNPKTADLSSITDAAIRAYQVGHRDARHAAAEQVSAHFTTPTAPTEANSKL